MNRFAVWGLVAIAIPLAGLATQSTSVPSRITLDQLAEHSDAASRDAFANGIVAEIVAQTVKQMCANETSLEPGIVDAIDAAAGSDRTLTPESIADVRQRMRDSAPRVVAICNRVVGAEVRRDSGLRDQLRDAAGAAADKLSRQEFDAVREFLDSPAGVALASLESSIAIEASRIVGRWSAVAAPALYGDVVGALRAELGPVQAAAVREAVTLPINRVKLPTSAAPAAGDEPAVAPVIKPAHLRNRDELGDACESFYPVHSRRLREEGKVTLLLFVKADGGLGGVAVETSSGYPALDVAAAGCIGVAAKFEPQQNDGRPVATWQRLRWAWAIRPDEPPPSPP